MHNVRISKKLSRTKFGTPAQMCHKYDLIMKVLLTDEQANIICGAYYSLWKDLNIKYLVLNFN